MSLTPPVRQVLAAGLLSMLCVSGPAAATTEPAPAASAAPTAQAAEESGTSVSASPVVAAAVAKLQDSVFAQNFAKDDVAAALAFYGARKDPLWTTSSGLTNGGQALVTEIGQAEQWGLNPKAFPLPNTSAAFSAADAQGAAEAQLTLAALTYARHAKGGRVRPLSISQLLDLTPPVRDPNAIIKDLEGQSDPAGYLVGLHPKHEQFQRLRAELVKRLGPVTPPAPVDEALLVKLPADGATIKPGSLHGDIALLRKRLKQPAAFAGQETLYDEKLAAAVTAFQTEKGLKANGQINRRTRTALNREGESVSPPDASRDTQRIVINMERWRWMPDELGASYVINNVPEYITRTFKGDKVIFKEKIIVGLPEWPTPSFSAEMKTIVFNPSWGVPDGIKAKELKPRLQRAGGGGFFDQLFGGGGGGAAVIKAYGFTAYRNGKPVDPYSVDWSTADLRQYSFIQPPGGENPLGFVKFMFPNTHDVYMHDTTQRHLFAQSKRPYSHGCIRVNDPMRFAEVLLEQDKGWSRDRAVAARRSSETVSLDNHIWVHTVYLTTWIDDDGKVLNFGDVYGLDSRVSQALGGRSVRSIETPVADVETSSIEEDGMEEPRPRRKKNAPAAKPAKQVKMPSSFSEAMSGLIAN
ncbi:MAG: L,D-transpeptidase family protein [Hyphomicrobium sp.]|nr:L,D-transpeptidase family protein [Hyphomicrobium sp.]